MMDKKEKFKLTLKEIVDKHGRESMLDGKNLKGLLMDYIPDCVAERNLLLSAIRLDIPKVLIRPSDIEINANKAINILKEELFVNDNAAVFIVDAIAYSLGVHVLLTTTGNNSASKKCDENCEIVEDRTSDPLFKKVLELALDCGQVSVSMLRRRFSIDNNRATSLVNTLYNLGIISENIGWKPCEVIMSRQEAERLFLNIHNNQVRPEELDDPLLEKALTHTLDCGQISVSMLQRRFSIGSTRATRLIDGMAMLGIIDKGEPGKICRVIISRQEAEARFKYNQSIQIGKEANYNNQNKVNPTNNNGRTINLHNPESNKNQKTVFPAQNIEELRKKYARAKAELDLADSCLKKAELSKRVAQERFNSAYLSNRSILQDILDRKTQGFDQAALDYQKALQNFQMAEAKYNKAVQSIESVCPCCKESNPNSAKFCHNCGTRIKR